VAGLLIETFWDVPFWIGSLIAFFSLLVNALVIEWEDRQPGGWSE
jgi:hypothetical protein